MGFLKPKVKLPPPAPEAPKPKAIPTAEDPSLMQAMVADAKKQKSRKGRMSSLLYGTLGDASGGRLG